MKAEQKRSATALLNTFHATNRLGGHHRGNFNFENGKVYLGTERLPYYAPHLQQYWLEEFEGGMAGIGGPPEHRGRIDAVSMRLAFGDDDMYATQKPSSKVAALIYEMLEQYRVESLAEQYWPGVIHNINKLFTHWSVSFCHSSLIDTDRGILLFSLAQMSRSRILAQPMLIEAENLIEHTRMALGRTVGNELKKLRRHRHDQTRYGIAALKIAGAVEQMLQIDRAPGKQKEEKIEATASPKAFSLSLELDENDENIVGRSATTGAARVAPPGDNNYSVFSTEFDKTITPQNQIRTGLLVEYREQIDLAIRQSKLQIIPLAKKIAVKLSQAKPDGRLMAQEAGYVDSARLPLLISASQEREIFYQINVKPKLDLQLSILVDNSGSMKHQAHKLAPLLDVLSRVFDMAGGDTEILGFTTSAWGGGRVVKQWRQQGSPPSPGRLNETCHMIFKPSNKSWKQARLGIAALMKLNLYREGIDGEAVQWACRRLRKGDSDKKILLVISDGCPMDTTTCQVNGPHYLENHLKRVVSSEQGGELEIVGLSLGESLNTYYERNMSVDLDQGLSTGLLVDIIDLIIGHK